MTDSLYTGAQVLATTTAVSSLVVSGVHYLSGFHITANLPDGGCAMIFDATSAPADGTVTPLGCFTIPPTFSPATTTTLSMANTPFQTQTVNGICLVISSTGPFTKTAATGYISILYQ